ncbi:hypothetical protein NAPIS_ORF02243 [Vairimorpha apis BRL 01]|uniref:Uncharacterized protein n=2 Tax=Vairimorpha apis BRL 01 TaxID=1037528 RepID=T0L6N8_9MICR|nr:hypothetical protein NAPIS_ORF02243 [Vairimorpha apis BRL 01]
MKQIILDKLTNMIVTKCFNLLEVNECMDFVLDILKPSSIPILKKIKVKEKINFIKNDEEYEINHVYKQNEILDKFKSKNDNSFLTKNTDFALELTYENFISYVKKYERLDMTTDKQIRQEILEQQMKDRIGMVNLALRNEDYDFKVKFLRDLMDLERLII